MMKIMYLGIAVWPSWEIAARKMWIWRRSIDRFGYRFFYYGVGTPSFPGYRHQKVESQLRHLLTYGYGDATHIFYTDCCDCLMLAPPGEIEQKYKSMGCPPMIVSASRELGNTSIDQYPCFERQDAPFCFPKLFRYPNVGGYLMEAPLLIEFLKKIHDDYPDVGDDCYVWYDGFAKGWFRPVLDSDCQFWQVRSHEEEFTEIVERDGFLRFRNKVTGSYPCIWHNSGGYADLDTFKDYAMQPWAERLGILAPGETRP